MALTPDCRRRLVNNHKKTREITVELISDQLHRNKIMFRISVLLPHGCKLILRQMGLLALICIVFSYCIPAFAVDDVYMFPYFKDPDGTDGLHLAYSLDGLSFHAVNGDVSVTGPMAGATTRDPCINLGPDGKFRIVHTTLPWDVTTQICYGQSDDL